MKKKRIRILFILPSLKAGGAERVITFVATNLDKEKFECEMLILGFPKDNVYDTSGIEVHFLQKTRLLKSIIPMFHFLRSHKPDIAVGSIAHVNRVLTTLGLYFRKIVFVGREASVDRIISKYANKNRIKYWKLYRNYYKNLDHVICQSHDMANDLINSYSLKKENITIISNPITGHLPIKKSRNESSEVKQFITVGRLSLEKGFDRLLNLISKLNFSYHYTIIGSGNQEENIMKLAKELNIDDKITHIQYTDTVAKYLAKSDVFLQGSFVEGFPNALLESCVVGTPVVAFEVPGGTREIIQEDINGFMVNSDQDFIDKLDYIVNKKKWDPEIVHDSVMSRFNKERSLKKYEDLFERLIN